MTRSFFILAAPWVVAAASGCQKDASSESGGAKATTTVASGTPAPAVELNLPSDPNNIVNIAANSKDHTTLVTALKAADFVYAVSNPGPITVFAPTNAAFDKLPKGTVEGLLKADKVEDLKSVLKHHVMPSTYERKDLKDGMTLGMVDGGKVTVHVKDGKMQVNDANVVAAIKASNGMVFVIDGVLLPSPK